MYHRLGIASAAHVVSLHLGPFLTYLCAIANRLDVDLEDALRRKEQLNETRSRT